MINHGVAGLIIWLVLAGLAYAESSQALRGIWVSAEELAELPTQGMAWQQLKRVADRPAPPPNIGDQNQNNNVQVMAKALVYARTGDLKYRGEVIKNCLQAIGTEQGGRTLALGRNLAAYVIAADLVGLEPDEDARFRGWLRKLLSEELQGRTLQSTHEDRPNNWGTHAGASRAAVAVYLDDRAELARTAEVFQGFLGNRASYASFRFGELSWQADPEQPVGINPKGAVKLGRSIDGALPDDLRRGGTFQWPPRKTGYAWEALQGAIVQAEILHRQGYPAWQWEDQALLRAVQFLHRLGWTAEGDDEWQIHLINYRYGTNFPAATPARHGKIMGWTDWTHARPSPATDGQHPLGTILSMP